MLEKFNDYNFGFGMMRLPYKGNVIDFDQVSEMVDYCLAHGINYFDTAHGYLNGESETAVRKCLTSRHKREEYILTDKLTGNYFNSREDIRKVCDEQLKKAGVDYFDIYLMHNQNKNTYPHFQECHAYEEALKLKEEGKIKHLGFSFHDDAEYLEKILKEHPEVEIVQIQFNYLDYSDVTVQSGKLYEVLKKYNKPIIVMEPVKGGTLANLPPDAKEVIDDLHNGSAASYALRYVRGFDQVKMIISGMSSFDQVKDNVETMTHYKILSEEEALAISKVVSIFHNDRLIPCTACRYCVEGCPKHIPIPDIFSVYNKKEISPKFSTSMYYNLVTKDKGKASDCIKCGRCEKSCPQHLKIRDYLVNIAKEFERV